MVKIGLEIHGYLKTKEKLFCSCKAEHGAKKTKPNTNICPICTGQPGSKPMLPNIEAIKKVSQIALILNCTLNKKITWQRKHYNWPDLPKGYQNTLSGPHAIPVGSSGKFLDIRITECHLEEDPAAWNPQTGEIDYNRSGNPLVEIVTEPDFKSSEEVANWLKQLKLTLGYIKAIDNSSGLKADVNISVENGKRIEVKNVNSIANIKKVIEYEIKRQSKNPPKKQETRAYDERSEKSIFMRYKEDAEDYRFISDPDLPQITLSEEFIKKISDSIPETPQEKLKKLVKKHKIPKKYAEVLTKNIDLAELFEELLKANISPKLATRYVAEELLSVLNYNKKSLDDENIDIRPKHIIELLQMLENEKITENNAKDILRRFIPKSFSPLSEAESLKKISNITEIKKMCKKVIEENPKAVEDYKSGNKKSINFLIGKVMSLSQKRADYKKVKETLENLL